MTDSLAQADAGPVADLLAKRTAALWEIVAYEDVSLAVREIVRKALEDE